MKRLTDTLFYGWIIALACSVSLAAVFGARLSFQVFFVALIDDFGWSRAATAGVFSLSMLIFAITSPLFGWLFDRYGPPKMFTVGALLFAGGLVVSSWISVQWQLYLWYGVVASLGITILGLTNYATIISGWFRRQRATAMGLAFAGTGIGTLVVVPLTEYWIATMGWRAALIAQGIMLLVVIVPLSVFILRKHPLEMGLYPDGDPSADQLTTRKKPSDLASREWTVSQVTRTVTFWMLIFAGFGGLFSLRMLTVHQVAAAVDAGIDSFLAATVMGFSGGIATMAYIGWGMLGDRIGRRVAFVISSLPLGGAIFCMISLSDPSQLWILYLYAVLFGLGEGSRSSLISSIINDTFPSQNLGRINGFIGMAFGGGAAAGSWLGGYLFDLTGSYDAALWVSLTITVLSAGCVMTAKT